MNYINSYKPSTPEDRGYGLYGPHPYDINISFPLFLDRLESDRIKLTPFIPLEHAHAYFSAIPDHAHFNRFLPFDMDTQQDWLLFMDSFARRNADSLLLAIIDKTRPDLDHDFGGSLAGIVCLKSLSMHNLSAEIATLMILPPFQRTHVTSHTVGILLRYCLQLPSAFPPGLGLRRVQWLAHPDNVASLKAAARMGFQHEGDLRWAWVLPEGRSGRLPRENDPLHGHGRDTTIWSITWEDWQSGGREIVDRAMSRLS